jgi:hypothetical protein
MGFRNPITTATAVDTRTSAAAAGARLFNRPIAGSTTGAVQGFLELDDGLGDLPAYLTNFPGTQRSNDGGSTILGGGSFAGHAGAELDLLVEPVSGGFQSHANLSADVFTFTTGLTILTLEDTGWLTAAPQGGWANVNTSVKVRRIHGVAYLALGAYNAVAWTAGSVIAVLPAGFAPATQVNLLGDWSGGAREVNVLPSGNVVINAAQSGGSGVVGSGSWPTS